MAKTAGAQQVGEIYYDVTLDTSGLIQGQRQVGIEVDKAAATFNRITQAVKLYATVMAALKISERADEFRLLSARVEVAAGSIEGGAAAFAALVEVSRRTQTSLAGNIEVFNRLNQSIVQMGGTQADTLNLTELLAKAIKVSGANAVEAKSAMLQFGQALGSGRLQGDELRSLLENAPYLMRQLAVGIGVPIGALKKLGEEGKLTSDVVVNALTKGAAQIEADFKKFPQTISGALQVAEDAAGLAALKFDELTGSSATMTGVLKGAGEVLDKLADQFGAANEAAGALGRNDRIKTWADVSRLALSYLVDAADVAWQALSVFGRNVAFVFTGVGKEIGGIGAQIAAVMRGDFAGARAIGEEMTVDSERRRKELDAADAKTLAGRKLFGEQMRQAWEQGAGGGRGSVNPAAASSRLKGGPPDKKKGEFDPVAYIARLRGAQTDEIAAITAKEEEALRIAKKHLDAKQISQKQYEEAVSLIHATAEDDRSEYTKKANKKIIDDATRQEEEAIAARKQRDSARSSALLGTLGARAGSGNIEDQVALVRAQAAAEIAAVEEARKLDLAASQLYADQKVAIEEDMNRRIADMRANANMVALTAASDGFGALTDMLRNSVGEQDSIYKGLFAMQKAFAIASAIVNIEKAKTTAMSSSSTWQEQLIAMGTIMSATAGIVSTIRGTNYGGGRQYGGPVTGGALYRVNETGRPEMFTAANGAQYMLPTANGNVTPAGQTGGALNVIVQIVNTHPTAQISATKDDRGQIVNIAVSEVANQIANNTGPVWSAMRGATDVQSRL